MNSFAKISLDASEYEKGLDKASGMSQSFGEKARAAFGTIAKAGAAGLAAASAGVIAFGKSAVDTGKQFDSSMAQVAATMGVTVSEIGELRDFAMDMGAKTAFSATQAADALNYMALAGYDAETSMKTLPSVLNLAAAGSMDLGLASDMITDSLSALGLEAEDATKLVDQMASASSHANASVAQMGSAILTVGGTAKVLGGGMMTLSDGTQQAYSATTELNQVLGLLADNGVKGAEGGTALRNIILSLTAPTDKAAKKLKELGVTVLDSSGNMRSMKDIFADLNNALGDMTEGRKTEVLNELFNKVDLKSVNALMNTNIQCWDELAASIENSKYAAELMAKVQLDNLAGDITLARSAFEGLQIVVSDGLTPDLRGFVQLATDGMTRVTDAFKQANEAASLAEGLRDAGGAMLPLEESADRLTERFGETARIVSMISFRDANGELKETGAFVDELVDKIKDASYDEQLSVANMLGLGGESAVQDMWEIIGNLDTLSWKMDDMIKAADAAASGDINILRSMFPDYAMDEILSWFDGSEEGAMKLQAALESVDASRMTDGFTAAMQALPGVIDEGIGMILSGIPRVIEVGGQILGAVVTGIVSNLPVLADGAVQVAGAFGGYLLDAMENALDSIGILEPVQEAFSGVGEAFDRIKDAVSPLMDKFTEWATSAETARGAASLLETGLVLLGDAVSGVAGFAANIVEGAAGFIDWLTEGSTGADALAAAITAVVTGFAAFQGALAIKDMISGVVTAIQGAQAAFAAFHAVLAANPIGAVIAVVAALAAGIIYLWNTNEDFRNAVGPIWEAIKGFFVGAWEKIKSTWDAVQPYFAEIWEQIKKTFSVVSDVLGGFFTRAWQVIQIAWAVVGPWFELIWRNIERTFSVAEAVLGGFFSVAWAAIKTVWDAAVGFFENIWNTIQGIFSVVESVLSGDFAGAWEAIKGVFSGWGDYFSGLFHRAIEAFSTIGDAFAGIGKALVDGLLGGIQDAWGTLTGWVGRGIEALKNRFTGKEGFDERSPSHWARRVGEYISIGLANGIESEASEAEQAAEKMASNIMNGLSQWANRVTKYEKLSLRDQLSMWEAILEQFDTGSDQWWSAYDKVFDLREKIESEALKAEEAAIREHYSALTSAAEQAAKRQNLSLRDQLATWENIMGQFERDSEQWAAAEEKVYDLRENVLSDYLQKVSDVNKTISGLEEDYQKELQSRSQSIYNSYKLFDEVQDAQEVNGKDLAHNLERQVSSIKMFYENLNRLEDRGVGAALVDEIRQMGVGAGAELSALLDMSDATLSDYVSLFEEKQALANGIALEELSGMKTEIDSQIRENMSAIEDIYNEAAPVLGETFSEGLAKGILSGANVAIDAAIQVAKEIEEAIRDRTGIDFRTVTQSAYTPNYSAVSASASGSAGTVYTAPRDDRPIQITIPVQLGGSELVAVTREIYPYLMDESNRRGTKW